MTRPLKTPDEDGINGPPDRGSIRARVKPSGVQLAVPSRLILLELRLRPRRCYLCRRVDWARRCTPRPDQASLLSWAMGLTTILTTIWGLSIEIRLSTKSLFLRKTGRMGTSVDTLPMSGGQRGREFKSRQPDLTDPTIRPCPTCIQRKFLPPSMAPSGGRSGSPGRKCRPSVQHGLRIGTVLRRRPRAASFRARDIAAGTRPRHRPRD